MTVTRPDFEQEDNPPEADDALDSKNEFPDEVEMTLGEHLEELRTRLFWALGTFIAATIGCFIFVKPIVDLLQKPAGTTVKFIQTIPGEFFFVSFKVAAYSGLMVAAPMILYQIVRFVLPGLSRRERKLILPIVVGSSVLFVVGVVFAFMVLAPAALNFFVSYGDGVVDQTWTIERYFDLMFVMLISTGIVFQVPILQVLLGVSGIVTSERMFSVWRYVSVFAVVLGAIVTPSTDPLTQTFLAGAVTVLYFGGAGAVKLIGK
ncbi:twin-arginine translocase subunit TatC [Gloeobacter morelensis]|uniref:Sec-independent protein translocase protein TatC n=1 Tax=Gloeobacter morelensis MG652769 TaxID=2781736 RepID=A0ABY3PMK6_9CYAN|nr:twin-arginine translocase subunit TatC [Gloeobacter morelensis]UFP94814.1 twin-arginine translocase subunit TatC [Gloeobacter morelensis MG652769]